IGMAFAGLLVAIQGTAWLERPTYQPALVFGVATVAAPWPVMQPAMGAGFAAAKTPSPLANRLRSLANHVVFGTGLYLAAAVLDLAIRCAAISLDRLSSLVNSHASQETRARALRPVPLWRDVAAGLRHLDLSG